MICVDQDGKRYELTHHFDGGGEGDIYLIKNHSNEVAKIYNDKVIASEEELKERESKILLMIKKTVQSSYNGDLLIAWPTKALYDEKGRFCGFIMPRVNSTHKIYDVYRSDSRVKSFPSFTWRTLLAYSYNLALVVSKVHAAGHVVGDMNPKNIVIDGHGSVCLIDSDSFNIVDKASGREFRCYVGVGECLAPELQGRNLKKGANKFSVHADDFSLAMTIFKILMNGHHPFNCRVVKIKTSSVGQSPLESDIAEGRSPYIRNLPGMTTPVNAPNFSMLPYEVQDLFKRAFTYSSSNLNIQSRPTAEEWTRALFKVLKDDKFKICSVNRRHVWPEHYNSCPWCEVGE